MNKILELIENELPNLTETALGEPQLFLYCENNRYLEITKEQDGLTTENEFYSIRYNCNDEEFEDNKFGNNGIIDSWNTQDIPTTTFKEPELIELLANILSIIK